MRYSAAIPLLLSVLLRFGESAADRVLLKDVTAITLNRGQMTTGRRSSPVPQLRCVGGAAEGVYSPKTVQCYNRGSDGSDVQWECKSTMDDRYMLGRVTVSCEGYDHPHDPYIVKGSCGLEYELEYTSGSGSKTKSTGKQEEGGFSPLLIVFVAIFAFIVYSFFTNRGDAQNRNNGSDGRGPPPYPGWRPGGDGDGRPPDAPPPYDDGKGTFTQGTSGSTGQSGPGFWSGAAAGAAAGYMAGRAQNSWGSSSTRQRTSAHSSSHQSAGSFDPRDDWEERQREDTRSHRSSDEHETTSFGGTSRR